MPNEYYIDSIENNSNSKQLADNCKRLQNSVDTIQYNTIQYDTIKYNTTQ